MEGVKRSEIEEKYARELDYPSASEELDLYLFETVVKPHYIPSERPWAMVIGALGEKAAKVIRCFHEKSYEIQPESVRVAACNRKDFSMSELVIGDDYDHIMSGELRGNASHEFTWAEPFLVTREEFRKYDLSFIRNPDMVDLENWSGVFSKAMEFTRPEGVVVTIIREYDQKKYNDGFLKALGDYGIRPVYSQPTGIINDRPGRALFGSNNFHHTIGIFKPKLE